ncbi:ComF family protein [Candidatus Daviesbacteria bacterium]|nr:ComF family protein [Candidatus Daviesbacteria bacterium]
MTNWILDILFPKKCVGCKKEGTYFCNSCVGNILQTDLVCPRCERLAMGGQTHPVCKRRYGLDGLWSLGIYQDPLRAAIQILKYQGAKGLGEILVDITLEYWVKYQPFVLDQIKKDRGAGWVVIPVPLYWWRNNSRGFNQASLIGQILSKKLGLAFCEGLKRVRYTPSQVKLKGRERKKNVFGVFEITTNYQLPASQGKPTMNSILLIDDVWTTGSTLKECCYVLKRSGAKKVWALTLAR